LTNKIPITKSLPTGRQANIQIISNYQISIIKQKSMSKRKFKLWLLMIGIYLVIDIWCLVI